MIRPSKNIILHIYTWFRILNVWKAKKNKLQRISLFLRIHESSSIHVHLVNWNNISVVNYTKNNFGAYTLVYKQ